MIVFLINLVFAMTASDLFIEQHLDRDVKASLEEQAVNAKEAMKDVKWVDMKADLRIHLTYENGIEDITYLNYYSRNNLINSCYLKEDSRGETRLHIKVYATRTSSGNSDRSQIEISLPYQGMKQNQMNLARLELYSRLAFSNTSSAPDRSKTFYLSRDNMGTENLLSQSAAVTTYIYPSDRSVRKADDPQNALQLNTYLNLESQNQSGEKIHVSGSVICPVEPFVRN